MTFTQREMRLAPIALLIILFGGSYFFGGTKLASWKNTNTEIELLDEEKVKLQHILQRKPILIKKLKKLMEQLPVHESGKSLTAEHQQQIQKIANRAYLQLNGMKPEDEKQIGSLDLYEMAISCNWQGPLESLVRFLFELQSKGAVFDVEQVRMQLLSSRHPEQLKGTVLVNLAYSRKAEE